MPAGALVLALAAAFVHAPWNVALARAEEPVTRMRFAGAALVAAGVAAVALA